MTNVESKGIISGGFEFCVPSHMNFGKLFLDRTLKYGNKVALVDGNTHEQITFAEMAQKIVNVAYSLTQLGVKKGEVVAICSENRIEFMITAVAVLYSGAVLTFLNSAYRKGYLGISLGLACKNSLQESGLIDTTAASNILLPRSKVQALLDEIIYIANISKPKYAFLSPAAYDIHYETLKDHNTIKEFFIFGKDKGRTDVMFFEELTGKSADMELYEGTNFYGRAHTALILYSSGTTGLPKGARLSHLNFITTAYQVPTTCRPLTMLNVSPFANTMGFQNVTDALIYGKTVVFLARFAEDVYLGTIERYKVGYILVAPPTVVTLCKSSIIGKYDLSSLEVLICGGAPLDKTTMDEAKTRFPNLNHVFQGYGMTETSGVIAKETESAYKFGSVGKVVKGIIVKIVDIETRKALGPNQPGELCVKGSSVFEDYIGKKMDEFVEGEYLKTGDIAYYDEEGYIFVVDRLKELIKYKGWQVPPTELEAVLLKHPKVRDVAVIGQPDKEAGELPTAFIVKKPGFDVTGQQITEFVDSQVSSWKRLRGGVRFVEEIPKNPSGKILRRLLREKLIKPASKL